ncbi:hypothetical protein ROTO_35770 [Roseovarius tolerans]|uniref:Uncharacterized protein n=1 Tax=Roseovarius tolerans TaxID=74031 RepID=A0A0L6CQ55_9RHOB|nr:hypothetical protein ROTO_35770 [Roseovarius tolerans]
MLPEVMRPGENPAVLHPDDLLVDEGAGFLPAGLQHRLPARGVPAVPGGVLGDRLGDGGRYEPVVEFGPLAAVVPSDAVGLAPVLVPRRVVRSVVVDEIRRVGRKQHRALAVHQTADIFVVRAVPAEQPMIAEDPQVACPRGRIARWLGDGQRRHGAPGATFFSAAHVRIEGQQLVEFAVGKADQRQVVVVGQQLVQFRRQQRLVPCSEFGQFIVGQTIGPALRLGQVPEHDHRRLGQPKLRRGQHPPVAGDQLAVLAHEARHGPAELGHAGSELRDLVGPVLLRVLRVRLQARKRPVLDPLRGEAQRHAYSCLWHWGRRDWTPPRVDSAVGATGFRLDSEVRGVSTPRGRSGL